jgi:hypothetical protein
MDWPLAISRNRDALLRIIAALFALAGLVEGAVADTLPRHIYRSILRVLRPAESAVRRLITIAARGLILAPCPARAVPAGLAPRTDTARMPAFCLIDRLKHFAPFAMDAGDVYPAYADDDGDADGAQSDNGSWSLPRISVPGFVDPVFYAPPPAPSQDDLIKAKHLINRLASLKRALDNLPREARRLARWQARRQLMLREQSSPRPTRVSPFRPGRPPGHRTRHIHEVDDVLRECHALALDARELHDSS